ncbi:MAG: protein phosphatase 2C domain-containing protein [Polyangiaceae bacterium]
MQDAAGNRADPVDRVPGGGPDEPVLTTRVVSPQGAGSTNIGRREHNEDNVLLRPEIGLFVLADGAGGHNAGNVASALATSTVAHVYEASGKALADRPDVDQFGLWTGARRLAAAIHKANLEIIDIAKKASRYHGMGTTIVALAFSESGDVVHVAHVGDSRCYRLRGAALDPITIDHSLMMDVLETNPDADDSLLERMPRHVVTRALGMDPVMRVSARTLRTQPGDVFLLCSDGLSGVLEDEQIEILLCEHRTPEAHVRALIEASLAADTQDNVAALVVECKEAEVPTRRPAHPHHHHSHRATEGLVMPPTQRAPTGSVPEIIIVGVETHVVPAQSASAGLLDAVGQLSRLRQVSVPEIAEPKPTRCKECGQPLEKGVVTCPLCGKKDS